MPEPTKFDCGNPHVVVPVQHPSGSIDQIAVPTDTTLEEFHGALADAGYLHDFPTEQPSAEDVLEKSPKFRQAAANAMIKTNAQSLQNSGIGLEAGFTIGNNGQPSAITTQRDVSDETRGHMRQYVGPSDFGALHSHDHAIPIHLRSRIGRPRATPGSEFLSPVAQVFMKLTRKVE